ncbi:histone deacetylase family protein [Amantichitinum ursilacus]|uniref:Histone deacetylase-like amidohydrolase n=1 Tax=Amantichitinum ursilacus TaxID=857265 RepID=A0A0N1JTP8_9NEIS|nr:histone deacetylase family protein [Amantichitinum ursilacus]KPC55136.1 Histone deacetylase-like amidohydrolase [Amantichitinum ursilacus]
MFSTAVAGGMTAYITHPACAMHDMGRGHPECAERLAAIQDRLIAAGLWDALLHLEAPAASRAQLERVHSGEWLDRLGSLSPTHGYVHLDPDTAINPYSLRAAWFAAGAGVLAVDQVMTGAVQNAFCAIRPPGHHAGRSQAMGFCLLNNVAVAAAHALAVHGVERVAIVDFDVHHGNGTEDIFCGDARVSMVGMFQHPFYPYSGDVALGPNMHNFPLPRATTGAAFRDLVRDQWLPLLDEFAPQLILISAGFDAHLEDDMASMGLVESDYAWVTKQVMAVAQRHCGGRIVSMLEGGYDLSSLGRSVAVHVKELAGL